MEQIKISELVEELPVLYNASEPILAFSLPGIGKTQMFTMKLAEMLAEQQGLGIHAFRRPNDIPGLFSIDGSCLAEESLVMPYVNSKAEDGQYLRQDLLAQMKQIKAWVQAERAKCAEDPSHKFIRPAFLVDEFTNFSQGDQRTLMNLILSGRFPDQTEMNPKDAFFILLGNPSADMPGFEDYDGHTNPVEKAVVTRGATFFLEADFDGFINWGSGLNKEGRSNLHPYLVAALNHHRSLFLKEVEDDIRVLNSRTAEKLSNYFYSAQEMGRKWNRFVVKAYFGDQVGGTIASTIDQLDKMVSLSDLFGEDSDTKLNAAALKKYKGKEDFEKYYLLLSSTDENSGVDYSKPNNVQKLIQLIEEGGVPAETIPALASRVAAAPLNTNAGKLRDSRYMDRPETNIVQVLMAVRQALSQL